MDRCCLGMGLPKVDGHEFQWHLSVQAWDCPWSGPQSRCKHGETGWSVWLTQSCVFLIFPSRQVRWKYNERSWKLPLERHVMDNEVCMHAQPLSCVQLFATPWTVAHQAPLSIRFSRQEYWSGLPCPPSGDLPNPGIKPKSLALASSFFTTRAT